MIFRRFFSPLFIVPILFIAALLLSIAWPLPSAETLSEEFRENRALYEEFVRRIREATRTGEPLSDFKTSYQIDLDLEHFCVQRHVQDENEMAAFNRSVGDNGCRGGTDSFGVRFLTSRRGIGVGTYGAGIAYLEASPSLYASMNEMTSAAESVEGFLGFRRIDDDWYVFLWEAD